MTSAARGLRASVKRAVHVVNTNLSSGHCEWNKSNYVHKALIPDLAPYSIVAQAVKPQSTIQFKFLYSRLLDPATAKDKYTRTQLDWPKFDRTDIYCYSVLRIIAALSRAPTLAVEYECSSVEMPKWPSFGSYKLELECAYNFLHLIVRGKTKDRVLDTLVDGTTGQQAFQQAKQVLLATSDLESHIGRLAKETAYQRFKKKKRRARKSKSKNTVVNEPVEAEDIMEGEGEEDEFEMFDEPTIAATAATAIKRHKLVDAGSVLGQELSTVSMESTRRRIISEQSSGDEPVLNELSPELTHKRKRGRADAIPEREASSSSFVERPVLPVRRSQHRLAISGLDEANPTHAGAFSERSSEEGNEALVDSIEDVADDNTAQHEPSNNNGPTVSQQAANDVRPRTVQPAEVPVEDSIAIAIKREDSSTASSPAITSEVDAEGHGSEEAVKVKLEASSTTQQLLDIQEDNAALEKAVEELGREKEKVELKVQEARNTALKRTLAKLQGRIVLMKGVNQEVIEIDDD
ncbi:hypothetical protein LTR15_004994 [Elasticomyces elasticus]|nr:hypothetical protein LTR15_004994 [Elasticomyces elasticus]